MTTNTNLVHKLLVVHVTVQVLRFTQHASTHQYSTSIDYLTYIQTSTGLLRNPTYIDNSTQLAYKALHTPPPLHGLHTTPAYTPTSNIIAIMYKPWCLAEPSGCF